MNDWDGPDKKLGEIPPGMPEPPTRSQPDITDARCDQALQMAAKERPEPTTAAWLPIGDAPETIQEFAKHCEIADDRKSYIEFGGTIEDGRPFVLCLAGAFSKVYDRWFILPNVDVVAAKEPQR